MVISKAKFLGAVLLAVTALSGQEKIPPPRTPGNTFVTNNFSGVVKAKASPDECYLSLGNNIQYDFIDQLNPGLPCGPGKRPKVNQGYVWGTAVVGTTIYFGTTPNGQCITQGGVVSDPANLTPLETAAYACEFAESPYYPTPITAAQIGDFRPPRIYKFETTTGAITDITPKAPVGVCLTTNPLCVEPLILNTRGIRAVAANPANPDIVMFAGPALTSTGGINFFAYRISTNSWIAKGVTTLYDNIRRFTLLNSGGGSVLYTAVGNTASNTANPNAGSALRYAGSFTTIPPPPPPTSGSNIPVCAACFTFQAVGNLDGEGAYLTSHAGRLYVSTWPKPGLAGLHMSPAIPPTGLTTANATQWTKVWSVANYEPDTTIQTSYANGALMSFGGYLYWGTMNVPWASTGVITQQYGVPTTQPEIQTLIVNSFRTISIWRGKDFDTVPAIDLLYGETTLPKYVPANGGPGNPAAWVQTPTGKTPLYGKSGFDNPYNNYTWNMNVFNNKLYVGTMDWSYLAVTAYGAIIGNALSQIPTQSYGADLWVFNNTTSAAVAENTNGVGNYTNYGVRNIVPVGTKLYLGTANPMNLLTNYTDSVPDGGWELLQMTPRGGTVVR
ncbi:MAG: hypothetical protein ACKV2U_03095 [Bryobacteraceae bacterium]